MPVVSITLFELAFKLKHIFSEDVLIYVNRKSVGSKLQHRKSYRKYVLCLLHFILYIKVDIPFRNI